MSNSHLLSYSDLVSTRQFTTVAMHHRLLLLDVDTACGFFHEIYMTTACDMALKLIIAIPFPLIQCLWLTYLSESDLNLAMYARLTLS
jgi:hypothetical protein